MQCANFLTGARDPDGGCTGADVFRSLVNVSRRTAGLKLPQLVR